MRYQIQTILPTQDEPAIETVLETLAQLLTEAHIDADALEWATLSLTVEPEPYAAGGLRWAVVATINGFSPRIDDPGPQVLL